MEIRHPLASEQLIVQALVQAVVDDTYGGVIGEPPLPVDPEDWTIGWAAVIGGRIVGIVLVHDDWIEDLWLAREFRSRGIGAALLAKAEQQVRDAGFDRARLRVVASNLRAQVFYLRHGWQFIRRYPHERLPTDMVDLEKQLS